MNTQQLQQQLKSHTSPVVVDLWAPWCVPCRVTRPVLEALSDEFRGRVDFLFINADEHPDVVRELGISGIPTLLLTRSGEILQTVPGAQSTEQYRRMFLALANSETPVPAMSSFHRTWRIIAGTMVGFAGFHMDAWGLVVIGGLIAFLGVYDRCPVWQAITRRFHKRTP
jgi:thioredoxin 1